MRTTINIRAEALQWCKQRSLQEGKTLGEIISEIITAASLAHSAPKIDTHAYTLPTSSQNGGLRPGISLDDSASIWEQLDEK